MISSAFYRFFGMVQISLGGCLPLSIWTSYSGLGQMVLCAEECLVTLEALIKKSIGIGIDSTE
jgi:hypothetical protein